ncbi:MAG: hypothetical protein DME69_02555 [Verrucomicrobia bacterium]|nr:MAG: hypothetical protein DME87_02715 [Verrucomicrobiota bacterium]PYJ79974.1 MAG: hypothetical protein DME69_02555 [Verrucomicrobiota bacterium]
MHPELKELLHEWRSDKSHISRIQLLSLWCHSTSLPGVFVKTFFFQIDMIRPAVRSCCTSVLNSGMQWMTRRIFTELFASDPSQPELAPLQNYLRCRCSESTARHRDNWMQKVLDSTPFPRFLALGLFNCA